jgi:hypothetical protein
LEKPSQIERRGPTKLWLPVVLAVGVLVGLVLWYYAPEPFRFMRFVSPDFQEIYLLHTILSTTSIALLVALTLIYVRVYAQTGARFALGITMVLFALLVQSLFQYPLILGFAGPFPGGQGAFLSFADVFTITAYTIFLYLSLE